MTRVFEFDPEKDAINWRKHKIHLATAALIFNDPMRVERRDDSEGNTAGEGTHTDFRKGGKGSVCGLYGTGERYPFNNGKARNRAREKELLWQ